MRTDLRLDDKGGRRVLPNPAAHCHRLVGEPDVTTKFLMRDARARKAH